MAVSDLLYRVSGQDAGGVDGPLVQFGPLELCGGRLGAHRLSGLLSTCLFPVTNGAPARFRAYPRHGVQLFECRRSVTTSAASVHLRARGTVGFHSVPYARSDRPNTNRPPRKAT
ncbi:hypothetical protein GCM10010371_44320 [Streptomyces subrutilus]|uniref:Uncharacterized protein n=1 Tax=Streptomyces subrutilus TaxID=36818 RepID=A0A918R1B0_9ACTN|nr:hypothetical protein GCM10010371_44320 [Streptomyces subrutilus]